MDAWMVWVLLAVVLGAGEVLSLGLFLAPFAVGAVVGALAVLVGVGGVLSVVVFVVASGLVFGLVRPVARRHLRGLGGLRTGAAALVGQGAVVCERVDNGAQTGFVRLGGELWTARSWDEEEVFEVGRRVQVVEIRGATALVSEV